MNKRNANRLNMFRQVHATLMTGQSIWSTMPAFQSDFDAFETKLDELNVLAAAHAVSIKGSAQLKKQKRQDAAVKAIQIAGAVRALAARTSDILLAGKLDFSNSNFTFGSAVAITHRMDLVLSLAIQHLPELADLSITQSDLDELTLLVNELKSVIEAPRSATIQRREVGTEMTDLFNEIDDLLTKSLDQMALVLKNQHPAFYNKYKHARKIIDHRGKTNNLSARWHDPKDPLGEGGLPPVDPLPPLGSHL